MTCNFTDDRGLACSKIAGHKLDHYVPGYFREEERVTADGATFRYLTPAEPSREYRLDGTRIR